MCRKYQYLIITMCICTSGSFLPLQWNPAMLGTNKRGWISEVAGFQGTFLMRKMSQSIHVCLSFWQGGYNSEALRFHCTSITDLIVWVSD